MKARYAITLALAFLGGCGTGISARAPQPAGWQIMQPPQIADRPDPTIDETAPLSKWVVAPADLDVYPNQVQCEAFLRGWQEGSRREGFPQYSNLHDKSRCVSVNDPQLKGN